MLPVQVTIRDIPNSTALENHIREKAQKLLQYYQRINSCRIVVEVPQKHKHQGKLYNVRIDVTVPEKELVVNRKKNEDVYIAFRDALKAIERQLESYARIRRGDVKHHPIVNRGVVTRIVANDDYGFIQGIDGDEYYFSAANMNDTNKFDQLRIGDVVQFIESTDASEGLQAQRVVKEKKNHTVFEEHLSAQI